jgi:prepilin-type processing-associated H-X9-DG protein
LFPVFARARENARRASCQSTLKQICLGIMQYTQDNDERMPIPYRDPVGAEDPKAATTTSLSPVQNYGRFTWVDAIDPYVKSGQIYHCPSDTIRRYEVAGKYGQISYGMNAFMNGFVETPTSAGYAPRITDWTNWQYYAPKHQLGQTLAAINEPAHKILLGDVYKGSGYAGPVLIPTISSGQDIYYAWPLDLAFDGSTQWGSYAITNIGAKTANGRHFGGANVAFADGHVKWMNSSTPGLMFNNSGTCSVGTCPGVVGTDEFIYYWNPTMNKPK